MDSINVLKSTIVMLEAVLLKMEMAAAAPMATTVTKKKLEKSETRHTSESFLEYGKKVCDDENWANGCRFPRKSWPLKADGTEYPKLQNLAAALNLECEKGTIGSEIYLHFG